MQFGEKKLGGGGGCFFFQEGGAISKGVHVSSFERGGPLAWEVHWHGGGGGACGLKWAKTHNKCVHGSM